MIPVTRSTPESLGKLTDRALNGGSRYCRAMQVIALDQWAALAVFGAADAEMPDVPKLPQWLAAHGAYRPARLTVHRWPDRPLDYIAVWPDGADVPDPDSDVPWRYKHLDGVVLAQPTEHFRCYVCRKRVNAVYPESGLPMLNRFDRHHWATQRPPMDQRLLVVSVLVSFIGDRNRSPTCHEPTWRARRTGRDGPG